MSEYSRYELAKELRANEEPCYFARRTIEFHRFALLAIPICVVALLAYAYMDDPQEFDGTLPVIMFIVTAPFWLMVRSAPIGETIVTTDRILSILDGKRTEIALEDVKGAKFVQTISRQYYKIECGDGKNRRIVCFRDQHSFLDCLPERARVQRSIGDIKGGTEFMLICLAFFVLGVLGGVGLGFLGLEFWTAHLNDIIDSATLFVIYFFVVFFVPVIGLGLTSLMVGVSIAIRLLRTRYSLERMKELARLGLDKDSPSGFARAVSRWIQEFLERQLSEAYGQKVRLD